MTSFQHNKRAYFENVMKLPNWKASLNWLKILVAWLCLPPSGALFAPRSAFVKTSQTLSTDWLSNVFVKWWHVASLLHVRHYSCVSVADEVILLRFNNRPFCYGVRTFHPMQFQPLPFQPLTLSTYCIFNILQFRPHYDTNAAKVEFIIKCKVYFP